jgi:hypothetical protein
MRTRLSTSTKLSPAKLALGYISSIERLASFWGKRTNRINVAPLRIRRARKSLATTEKVTRLGGAPPRPGWRDFQLGRFDGGHLVLPGNCPQHVQQHSVNRLEARCNRGKKNLGTIRVHFELQRRYSKTLFGESLFEVMYLGMAQLGFEQALILINVPLMDA